MESSNEQASGDISDAKEVMKPIEIISDFVNSENTEFIQDTVDVEVQNEQLLGVENKVQNKVPSNEGSVETSQEEQKRQAIQRTTSLQQITPEIESGEASKSSPDIKHEHDPQVLNIIKTISVSTPASPSSLSVRYSDVATTQESNILSHVQCVAQLEQQRKHYEQQLETLRTTIAQKDNMITLFQRENGILEKEKQAFRKEKELANKEKESTVIKFAMKEKLLIDAKKEKESVDKQLAEAKKEVKNVSLRFQAVNEEKSRMTYMIDEKCNEVRKYQRECEKLKTEMSQLESRLKYHVNKLNIETESKAALEKKLEEERNAPNKLEEKANEKLKVEYEANTILLKHEITNKLETLDQLTKDNHKLNDTIKQLQQQFNEAKAMNTEILSELSTLREEHNSVQNAYSEEMLNSAKLRGQLEELQVLRTQNTLNEEKIEDLNAKVKELENVVQENGQDLEQLHAKERELLSINKEMSESIVQLQNGVCLMKSKAQGIEAENNLLKQEKLAYDNKYEGLAKQLNVECAEKNAERQLLAKYLSEKTKMYETTKIKLENVLGDFEATKHKHATVVKELQRELQKHKKNFEQPPSSGSRAIYCSKCECSLNGYNSAHSLREPQEAEAFQKTHSRNDSFGSTHSGSRRPSETSETETTVACGSSALQPTDMPVGPSKKVLVERILRLQQASARQTEKIDFLENHTLSLVAELQKKSKVVQYYMLRDQTAGALTSTKSDENKSELAKYGNGVMAAIYGGIKNENKSMTLDLSLEINKKLQAVLEDTLLKNITLKENLDVLGLEVDNLTRKLRQLESCK